MRKLVLVAATALMGTLLGACSVETSSSGHSDNPAGGYQMQIIARDGAPDIYLITAPDGNRVAAQVDNGVSSVMDANEARLALGEARAAAADLGPPPETQQVNISVPGFHLSVNADDEHVDGNGRARINISAGGRDVQVDAAGEDADGHALVRIGGASESDARGFIEDQDDLTAETKRQMLEQLGIAPSATQNE